ncbi:polysaccharide biosynthesis tyrosine autokinase [Microbacterium shaanxiense]
MVTATGPTPQEAQELAEAWLRAMATEIQNLERGTAATPAAVELVVGDSARIPSSPSSPNTRLNVGVGAAAGLALGLAYAFVRRAVDRRVRHPRDVERETGVSVIGVIPLEKSMSDERQVIDFSLESQHGVSHHTIESMRELRTNLQFIDVDNPPRVIVVTSSVPGDGKSTVSVNLASSLAAAGQWAIFIDCDLRRPVIADIFGMSKDVGLTDVLAGRADLQDVAHRPSRDVPLAVVGAGRIPPNPSELLGSHRMRDFLAEISKSAIVILDSPPVLPVTDAAVLAAGADGVLIVVSSGKTTFDMLQRAIENITRTTGRVLGVVLNRVPRKGPASAYSGRDYYESPVQEADGAFRAGGPDARRAFAEDADGVPDASVTPASTRVRSRRSVGRS